MTQTPKDPDILSDPHAQAWRRGELEGGPTMTPQPMTQTQDALDADAFADLVEHMDMMLAMREQADTCTTYSGRTQEIGALVADNRTLMRKVRDHLRSTSPAGEVGEPSEPGGFVGDIFFGHPEYSTMGTHRWDGDKWERLRSEVEVLCDLLAAARNERDNLRERLAASDTEAMRLPDALNDIAEMMREFVDNWPEPKRFDTALKLIAKTMRAALTKPDETYAEWQQKRGMLADHVDWAINEYDEFMKDDAYDSQRVLDRIIARLRETRSIDALAKGGA